MVDQHAEKCPYCKPRLDDAKCLVLLALSNVLRDEVINALNKIAKKAFGQLMLFKSLVKEKP